MTVKVGIVGWGEIARVHASALTKAGAQLRGVISRDGTGPDGVERFESLDAMLPHVDAVTIAVPNHLHADCCLAVVRAGRAVMVEKPLIISPEQLDRVEHALLAANVPIHVGFRLHWNPRLVLLRDALKHPVEINCTYEMGIDSLAADKNWTRQFAQTGGAFFTLGVHMLDLARWLLRLDGAPLSDLRASADGCADDVDYPLRAEVKGRGPSGARVVAVADTRGTLPYRIVVSVRDRDDPTPQRVELDASSEKIEYEAMMCDFVEATARRRVDRAGVREILQVHRELLRARTLSAASAEPHPASSTAITPTETGALDR